MLNSRVHRQDPKSLRFGGQRKQRKFTRAQQWTPQILKRNTLSGLMFHQPIPQDHKSLYLGPQRRRHPREGPIWTSCWLHPPLKFDVHIIYHRVHPLWHPLNFCLHTIDQRLYPLHPWREKSSPLIRYRIGIFSAFRFPSSKNFICRIWTLRSTSEQILAESGDCSHDPIQEVMNIDFSILERTPRNSLASFADHLYIPPSRM